MKKKILKNCVAATQVVALSFAISSCAEMGDVARGGLGIEKSRTGTRFTTREVVDIGNTGMQVILPVYDGNVIQNPPTMASGNARVCAFRKKKFVASGVILAIKQNGTLIGWLDGGDCLTWEVPGNRPVTIQAQGVTESELTDRGDLAASSSSAARSFTPPAGQVLYLEVEVGFGGSFLAAEVREVPALEAGSWLKGVYRMVEPFKLNDRYLGSYRALSSVTNVTQNGESLSFTVKRGGLLLPGSRYPTQKRSGFGGQPRTP